MAKIYNLTEYTKKINENELSDEVLLAQYMELVNFIEQTKFYDNLTVNDALEILLNRRQYAVEHPAEIDKAIKIAIEELPFRVGKFITDENKQIYSNNELSITCPYCNTIKVTNNEHQTIYCYKCGLKMIV